MFKFEHHKMLHSKRHTLQVSSNYVQLSGEKSFLIESWFYYGKTGLNFTCTSYIIWCHAIRYLLVQGGSSMTGTDLYVNKPHCAAAVRP